MVLFMLPLLFNPFGLAFSWLPFLYLSTWPLIIQTAGRDTLMTHAMALMLFVLTCDLTRRLMLKLIGFDLISLPAGLALLVALATDKGSALLSLIKPLFAGLLAVIEPLFLVLELYVFLRMIRNFNRWLTKLANVRDEESQDLSNWEPPLTRGSLTVRALVILLTLLSYVGVYVIIHESKGFLTQAAGAENIPLTFNHAIAALVTLQLIAISLTIYKEDGILSESAMIALLASVPIFVASLSYYHAKQTHLSSRSASSWTSYFPLSLLFGPSLEQKERHGFDFDATQTMARHLDLSPSAGSSSELLFSGGHVDFGQVESSLLDGLLLDDQSKKLLSAPLKQLIMIINSILGLSVDKMAKYYFSLDFWYILLGRALCIGLWTGMGGQRGRSSDWPASGPAADPSGEDRPLTDFLRSLLNRTTVVKLLLILAYSQMLIQQMDNQAHLIQDLQSSEPALQQQNQQQHSPGGCCHGGGGANKGPAEDSPLADWFNCMWTSAKACSGSANPDSVDKLAFGPLLFRITSSLIEFCARTFDSMVLLAMSLLRWLASIHLLLHSVGAVWLARWRSPIAHRLVQSMVVQVSYICSLMMSSDSDHDDDYDS